MFLYRCQIIARLFLMMSALFILPHCARYQPSALLRPLSRVEKGGIEVGLKELTRAEFRRYFDSNLSTKNFAALQLYIKNRTSTTYILDPDNISVPLERTGSIARQIYRNTILRVTLWAVPGQIFWPCNIPAIVDGISSYEANKEIDEDIKERGFGTTYVEIKPRTSFNRVFFVDKRNYSPNVTIMLDDFEGVAPLTFDFDLKEQAEAVIRQTAEEQAQQTQTGTKKPITVKNPASSWNWLY